MSSIDSAYNIPSDLLVTAYALHRPDGQWSVMLINKDHDHPHRVRVLFHDSGGNQDTSFVGKVTMITFGKEQYQWYPGRKKGYAAPDGPPEISELESGRSAEYNLPAASVAVLRGTLGVPGS